jgi:MT0933-like antitoxin protein
MGFTDKIKGLIGGNKEAVKDGVDKAADVVESKTPDSVDAQVEKGADALKDVVDKID